MLAPAEQLNEQVGTGYIRSMSYILAATLNLADAEGFEELSFTNWTYWSGTDAQAKPGFCALGEAIVDAVVSRYPIIAPA